MYPIRDTHPPVGGHHDDVVYTSFPAPNMKELSISTMPEVIFTKLSKVVVEHEKQISEILTLLEVDNLHNATLKIERLVNEDKLRGKLTKAQKIKAIKL